LATFDRALHVGLTVRDVEASAEWYRRVLGFRLVKRFAAPTADETAVTRILLLHPDSGFLIGLYDRADASRERFSPLRTGLDHLAFEVSGEQQLADWVDALNSLGVKHSPIRDLGHSRFVSFEDPDGIQFELWQTIQPHRPIE